MTIPFDYRAPATLAEALALLCDHGEEAKPLAGGQSLVPLLALRLARPAVLVDLHRLDELRAVRREGDALFVGALVRHRALERGDGVLAACPLLQEAAALIGNVRVRTLGTIGGSLAHADPAAEWPAVARVLAGVGSIPQRLPETEAALAGRRPDPETLRRAAAHTGAIEPEGDAHASAAYRRHLARVLTARALARAAAVAARRGAA